jgi:hypothetical protein
MLNFLHFFVELLYFDAALFRGEYFAFHAFGDFRAATEALCENP